jgi:teichuronic acid exporter
MKLHLPLNLLRSQTAKDSTVSFLGQFIAGLFGAVFFALSGRILSLTDFGLMSLSLTTAVIIKDILDPAVSTTLLRFVSGREHSTEALATAKYLFILKLKYFLVIAPVLILLHPLFSAVIFKQPAFVLIILTVVNAFVMSLATFISGYLQATKRFGVDGVLTALQPIIRLIGVLILIFFSIKNVYWFLGASLGAYLLIALLGFIYITPKFLFSKEKLTDKRAVNSFLPHMVFSTLTGTLADRVNLYLINFFSNPTQVGLFFAAMQLFIPVKQLAGSLTNVFGTRFASFTNKHQEKAYLNKSLLLVTFLSCGLLLAAVIAKPLLFIVYGQKFLPVIPVFQILCVGFTVFIMQTPFSAILLYSKGRADLVARIGIVQLLAVTVFNFLLIPLWQLNGAAIATVLLLAITALITVTMAIIAKEKSIK